VTTNYTYAKTTSTSSLRRHLDNYHQDLYLRLAKERNWKNMLPSFASQARSQGANEASAGRRDEFTEEKFHRYLLEFIVVDDQVRLHLSLFSHSLCLCFLLLNYKSLNVVECPEFRRLLLLLRSDLMDTQIPHRTKLHELLLQAWAQHFKNLRCDLAACLPHFLWDLFSFF